MNAKIFGAVVLVFSGAMLLSACQQQVEMDLSSESNERFLAENAEREGVVVLSSGLQYRVIAEGEGETPLALSP